MKKIGIAAALLCLALFGCSNGSDSIPADFAKPETETASGTSGSPNEPTTTTPTTTTNPTTTDSATTGGQSTGATSDGKNEPKANTEALAEAETKLDAMLGNWEYESQKLSYETNNSDRTSYNDMENNTYFSCYKYSYNKKKLVAISKNKIVFTTKNDEMETLVKETEIATVSEFNGTLKTWADYKSEHTESRLNSYDVHAPYGVSLEEWKAYLLTVPQRIESNAKNIGVNLSDGDICFIAREFSQNKDVYAKGNDASQFEDKDGNHQNAKFIIFKIVGDKLYVIIQSSVLWRVATNTVTDGTWCDMTAAVFNRSEESGGEAGSALSFSLQGEWIRKEENLSGRYLKLKEDGSFDFYKNGSTYGLYTNRKWSLDGSQLTISYTASGMSVTDTFEVSGSKSQMRWKLKQSSSKSGGNTSNSTDISNLLLAFWGIAGTEATLIPR